MIPEVERIPGITGITGGEEGGIVNTISKREHQKGHSLKSYL